MSLEKKLQAVPAKKLGLSKTLGIFIHLIFSKNHNIKHPVKRGIALTLAVLVGLLSSTSTYAYTQADLKEGDVIYPAKLLAERTVALIKTDPVLKAEYYQELADRRTYEAGLYLANPNFEFQDEVVKQRFLGTLQRADQWNSKALEKTEQIDNTEVLENLLTNIAAKQNHQVEALNSMVDSLGLEIERLEVEEVLETLDEAQLRQEAINEVKEEIKEESDIKPNIQIRVEQKRTYRQEELESKIQYHKETLDETIEELEQSEVENKDVILQRLKLHKDRLEEYEEDEDKTFFNRTRALEKYGQYKARQMRDLRDREDSDD